MEYQIQPAKKFRGRWRATGDKSLTHRAFLFNALAEGEAEIRNANPGEDCGRTRRILEQLGVTIEQPEKGVWLVTGRGGRFREPEETLDAGNSGTTMRLMAGALAAQPFAASLDGDESLRNRPMNRIKSPLEALGARVETAEEGLPPVTVHGGGLKGCEYESPVASAQVKSAFLLGALRAEGDSAYREPQLSRDHTERLLGQMGVEFERDDQGWIRISGPQELRALNMEIPGDISSAAFLIAAGLVVENANVLVKNVGVNPSRIGFLNALERMGARFALYHPREAGGEPVADLLAQYSKLQGITVEAEEVPSLIDEIPILAALAARAKGESRFLGLGELRVKESDRLASTVAMISAFGGKAREEEDALIIQGGKRLRGTEFDAAGDHRLAMAASVLALVARGESRILGTDCVATSFPEFPSLMKRFSNGALVQAESEPA